MTATTDDNTGAACLLEWAAGERTTEGPELTASCTDRGWIFRNVLVGRTEGRTSHPSSTARPVNLSTCQKSQRQVGSSLSFSQPNASLPHPSCGHIVH